MSNGVDGIKVIAVINPCLYGVVFPGTSTNSFAGLYGIVPPELKLEVPTRQLASVLDQWRTYNSNVKELILSAEKVEFEQSCLVDGIAFGKFILTDNSGQTIDVKEYLCQTTIGAASDDPFRDALIIKNNSLKPEDLSSFSSSDESVSPSIKEKVKARGRGTGLKKPLPLPLGKLQEPCNYTISEQDCSLVRAIVKNQSVPSDFCQRFSLSPRPRFFNSPPVQNISVVKKTASTKYVNLEQAVISCDNDVVDDYAKRKSEWIEAIASKHSFVKIIKPVKKLTEEEDMSCVSSSPVTSKSMGRGRLMEHLAVPKMGRGKLLRTILESDSVDNRERSSGLGRGQYLNSSITCTPKVGGRGQWLRKIVEQSEQSVVSQPGPLKRVFSLDIIGGSFRATMPANEDSLSESGGESSANSAVYRESVNNTTDVPSSSSLDSLNQLSNENQHNENLPEEFLDSESDNIQLGSQFSIKTNQDFKFTPEDIPRDCPLNEYLEKLVAYGGLIHGKNPMPPKTYLTQMDLNPLIIKSLQSKSVKDLERCQSFSIPAIVARRNVVIIGPPKSGKTLAAIIPLLSLLSDHSFYSSLKPGCGPRAVLITSFAHSVRYATQFINMIAPHLTVVSTYGGGLELERKEQLVNGCDILVSTSRCWLRLLNYKWVTSLNRLCHLYIDDMDIMMKLYKPELFELLKIFDGVKSRKTSNPEPQMVLIGESWTHVVNEIVFTKLKEPLLCMTSYLEAALYAHIKPRVHILDPKNKVDKLFELLRDKNELACIIVCSSSDEVSLLRKLLYTQRSKIVTAHGHMTMPLLRDAHVNWQNLVLSKASPPLMIVSDDVLCDMGINNAQWLCHYSLPASKTSFSYRFSSIKAHFMDRLNNPQATTSDCFVDILVDYTNDEQLPDVMAFMQRLKTQIPEELLSAVERILKAKEMSKNKEVGLCEALIRFGRCLKESKCKQQHCINYARDKPRNLPLSGYVKVQILNVHSASHYSVRLIAHTEDPKTSPDSWTPAETPYMTVALRLNSYYTDRNNRKMHGTVQVGDLAAVEVEPDTNYRRVKVLQITGYDERRNPSSVKVHYMDEGTIAEIKALQLLHLPNELRTFPPTSFDMYLTGLLPVDLEKDWSMAINSIVKKKISSVPDEYEFVAKVALVVGYKMLVDSLRALKSLKISKCNAVLVSIKDYLLENNLAVRNPDHLSPLIKICLDANLPVSAPVPQSADAVLKQTKKTVNQKKVERDNANQINWAHLPKGEKSSVLLTSVENPSHLYVCHVKYQDLLVNLEDEINEYMANNPKLIDSSEISPHLVCLAKQNDRWNRGMLCKDQPEVGSNGDELKYPVFFVDYGDLAFLPASDIAICPNNYITKLPFQAIKCELIGLSSLNGEWPDEAVDVLYNITQLTSSKGTPLFKELTAIVINELSGESKLYITEKHYRIVLIDSTSGTDVFINKELVSKGLANWNPSEKHILDTTTDEFLLNTCRDNDDAISETTFGECKSDDEDDDSISTVKGQSSSGSEETSSGDMKQDELIEMLENFDIQLPSSGNSPLNFLEFLQRNMLSKAGKKKNYSSTDAVKKPIKALQKVSIESENDADISEMEDNRNVQTRLTECQIKSGFFTPKTGWLQNDTFVYVRIMIPAVEKYMLTWSSRHFDFSTSYDGKRYRLFVDLFGPISPKRLIHNALGQYVQIKMMKVLTDFSWPRLLYDEREKPIWLFLMNEPELKAEDALSLQTDFGEISSKHFNKRVTNQYEGEILHYDRDDHSEDSEDAGSELEDNIDHYDPLH